MSAHESFNRSRFAQLVNSAGGRVFRLSAGAVFLAVGVAYRAHPLGLASLAWSVLPLSAGAFDVCWISAALGGPLSGRKIRALGAGLARSSV
jgi:hypothetical protein